VVVDLGLPRIDGGEVIHKVRAVSTVPIIVLSARDTEESKVRALDLGADDYVTKPFGMDEFVARIRAALRRGIRPDGDTVIETAAFTVDLVAKRITKDGTDVHLTATEWRVLAALIAREGEVVSHEELLTTVWGANYEAPVEYARVFVRALRKKLEHDAAAPAHILTEPSLGYRFQR
jgi:two-component system, OmpR family, KDP operon response regulator KdpE